MLLFPMYFEIIGPDSGNVGFHPLAGTGLPLVGAGQRQWAGQAWQPQLGPECEGSGLWMARGVDGSRSVPFICEWGGLFSVEVFGEAAGRFIECRFIECHWVNVLVRMLRLCGTVPSPHCILHLDSLLYRRDEGFRVNPAPPGLFPCTRLPGGVGVDPTPCYLENQ